MLTSNTIFHPHSSLVFTRLDETEGVLLNLDTKHYYSLNESGALLWEWLLNGMSLTEMSHALQGQYDLTSEEAVEEVLTFLSELHEDGLIRPA